MPQSCKHRGLAAIVGANEDSGLLVDVYLNFAESAELAQFQESEGNAPQTGGDNRCCFSHGLAHQVLIDRASHGLVMRGPMLSCTACSAYVR